MGLGWRTGAGWARKAAGRERREAARRGRRWSGGSPAASAKYGAECVVDGPKIRGQRAAVSHPGSVRGAQSREWAFLERSLLARASQKWTATKLSLLNSPPSAGLVRGLMPHRCCPRLFSVKNVPRDSHTPGFQVFLNRDLVLAPSHCCRTVGSTNYLRMGAVSAAPFCPPATLKTAPGMFIWKRNQKHIYIRIFMYVCLCVADHCHLAW